MRTVELIPNPCYKYIKENKVLAVRTMQIKVAHLGEGSDFPIGNWEVEITSPLDREEFLSGRVFVGDCAGPAPAPVASVFKKRKGKKKRSAAPARVPMSSMAGGGSSGLRRGAAQKGKASNQQMHDKAHNHTRAHNTRTYAGSCNRRMANKHTPLSPPRPPAIVYFVYYYYGTI